MLSSNGKQTGESAESPKAPLTPPPTLSITTTLTLTLHHNFSRTNDRPFVAENKHHSK